MTGIRIRFLQRKKFSPNPFSDSKSTLCQKYNSLLSAVRFVDFAAFGLLFAQVHSIRFVDSLKSIQETSFYFPHGISAGQASRTGHNDQFRVS